MRTEGQAKAGQFPCPPTVVDLIATYIQPAPAGTRAADPFGAEGAALAQLCDDLAIPPADRYLAELQAPSALIARRVADHVVVTDTFASLRCSAELVTLLWNNPPFDHAGHLGTSDADREHAGSSEREELRALNVLLGKSRRDILQPGGIHIFIAPQSVMARKDVAGELVRWHDHLQVWAFPADCRAFGEAICIGSKRATPITGVERQQHAAAFRTQCLGDLPALVATATPPYTLPTPRRIPHPVWRDATVGLSDVAHAEITRTGGIWTGSDWQRCLQALDTVGASPLTVLNADQAAVWIAAGKINNRPVVLDGREVRIKGGTHQVASSTAETSDTERAQVTVTTTFNIGTPQIALHDPSTGEYTIYDGGDAIGDLISRPGNGHALIDAVAAAAPPRYTPATPNPAWWQILSSIKPQSGRKLPGAAEPGLNARQKHSVMAALEGLINPDPRTGHQLTGVIQAWEPRTGKTNSNIALAETLRRLKVQHPSAKRTGRAFTALVAAPALVIGAKAQVEAYHQGKVSKLPEWYASWQDLLPAWHIEILESPHDVAQFFRGAQTTPDVPRVGMLTLSALALDAGWQTSALRQQGSLWHRLNRTAHAAHEELDREARAGVVDAADHDAMPATGPTGAGISPRTVARDALLRPAYRPQKAGAVVCPDCQRVQVHADGEEKGAAKAWSDIRSIADGRCQWCGAMFAHRSRRWNNTSDKKLRLFTKSSPWHTTYATHTDRRTGAIVRTIPWGSRPTSNPRMALGSFIKARYAGWVDVLILDEAHKSKGGDTAIGRETGKLIAASHRTVALTGTIFGGKAADVWNLLWHMGNPLLRAQYRWDDRELFVRTMGLIKEVTTEKDYKTDSGVFNGKSSRSTRYEELPGITAALAEMVLMQSVNVQLVDMGFRLVPYTERAVYLTPTADVESAYDDAAVAFTEWCKKHPRAMGSGLQMLLQYPFMPHAPKTMRYQDEDENWITWQPWCAPDDVQPHHQWLADYIVAERARGRKVLVYCEHTGTDDLMPEVERKIRALAAEQGVALRSARLYSEGDHTGQKIRPGARDAWFSTQAQAGVDFAMCNPRLVDVGISLLDFPSVVFLQPSYSLFVFDQAKKRPWGPMQTTAVEVTCLAYEGTMSSVALTILAEKSAALACLKGNMLNAGIAAFGTASMSLFAAMAKAVAHGTDGNARADDAFATASARLNALYTASTADEPAAVATTAPVVPTADMRVLAPPQPTATRARQLPATTPPADPQPLLWDLPAPDAPATTPPSRPPVKVREVPMAPTRRGAPPALHAQQFEMDF